MITTESLTSTAEVAQWTSAAGANIGNGPPFRGILELRQSSNASWVCGWDLDNYEPFGCPKHRICANDEDDDNILQCCGPELNLVKCDFLGQWMVPGSPCVDYGAKGTTMNWNSCSASAKPSCGVYSILGVPSTRNYLCVETGFSLVLSTRMDLPTASFHNHEAPIVTSTSRSPHTNHPPSITRISLLPTSADKPQSAQTSGSTRVRRALCAYILLSAALSIVHLL